MVHVFVRLVVRGFFLGLMVPCSLKNDYYTANVLFLLNTQYRDCKLPFLPKVRALSFEDNLMRLRGFLLKWKCF